MENGSDSEIEEQTVLESLNQAFLTALSEDDQKASLFLSEMTQNTNCAPVAKFYKRGLQQIKQELDTAWVADRTFADEIIATSRWISSQREISSETGLAEKMWAIFFPEGMGLRYDSDKSIEELRDRRKVVLKSLNPHPIHSPLDEILFTSNILLTIPSQNTDLNKSGYKDDLKKVLNEVISDEQLYWYDHPIQIGVEPENNEVLYGMKGLNDAVAFEKKHKKVKKGDKITCVLSASVTHARLHEITKSYLEEEFRRSGPLANIDLYVFTETETRRLINEVLVPAATHYLDINEEDASDLLQVIGVDGMYGRHYSFLKAINAFWYIFIDPRKKATFKIDLDQVFPQEILVEESGKSAFEHLRSPLWGADGKDSQGNPVHLGMIAGALVNEKDISKSLFTPDVPMPTGEPVADELIFFSKLPQAISTQAEMMTRYGAGSLDGKSGCIERVHVTGGTNGILAESLFKYRPFTPSFFGRAEDQAYILSTFHKEDKRLTYLHASGLIMRHDKEAFAQEAMEAAAIGKLIGDYTRILLFSAYANIINKDSKRLKKLIDPFTGSFVSRIPVTVVYLRFALKAALLFSGGKTEEAIEFIKSGADRIQETIDFVKNDMETTFQKERRGWSLYYDVLETCQSQLQENDEFVQALQRRAKIIIGDSHINFKNG